MAWWMKRRAVAASVALLLAAWLAIGCAQVLGIEEIEPRGGSGGASCTGTDPAECRDQDPCTEDSCDPATGQCVHTPFTDVAPADDQIPGDCRQIYCQAGVAESPEDPGDVPVDGAQCTEDLCTAGTPSNPPAPRGAECDEEGGQQCDGDGACKKVDGQPCDASAECLGGICPPQDHVCCNEPCDGTCVACVHEKTLGPEDGICGTVPQNHDPDAECGEDRCNGEGACYAWCAFGPDPPGGTCPPVCNGGCSDNGCTIECSVTSCQGQTVTCPPGFHCYVDCEVSQACLGTTIECPDEYGCNLSCTGPQACDSATLNCSELGVCIVGCDTGDACDGTVVNCGQNLCRASCPGSVVPTFNVVENCGATGCI